MAITKGAKKANRASKKKRVFNSRRKDAMKDVVKKYRGLVSAGNKAEALKTLPELYKAIDKAAKRGVIKANKANRDKSRLTAILPK